jgi:hypothetical protein
MYYVALTRAGKATTAAEDARLLAEARKEASDADDVTRIVMTRIM